MTKLKDLKARFMEDPAFREEYARIDEEYALIEALVRARTAARSSDALSPIANWSIFLSRGQDFPWIAASRASPLWRRHLCPRVGNAERQGGLICPADLLQQQAGESYVNDCDGHVA